MTEPRHRCRYCRTTLKAPEDNDRQAFCTRGCHSSHYRKRCVVCEAKFERKNEGQKVCGRRPCRNALKSRPELYSYARMGQSAGSVIDPLKNPIKPGIKTRLDGGRPWRQIAGPELSARSFALATLPLDPATAKRVAGDNSRYWREDRESLLPYVRYIEGRLLGEPLPFVESPPLVPADPFDIPAFLVRAA